MKNLIMNVSIFIICILIVFGSWKLKRWFNYQFDYSSQVKEEIEKTVKKECLK